MSEWSSPSQQLPEQQQQQQQQSLFSPQSNTITSFSSPFFNNPISTLDDSIQLEYDSLNIPLPEDTTVTTNNNNPIIKEDEIIDETPYEEEDSTKVIRRKLIHINVESNPTPFGLIPICKERDTLNYARDYMERKIHNCPKNFLFLSNSGSIIEKDQENELLIYDQIVSEEWKHHTFTARVIQRDHLFIRIIDVLKEEGEDDNIFNSKKRKRDDSDSDDDKDNEKRRRLLLEELFNSAPLEIQQQLAMKVFEQNNYNVKSKNNEEMNNKPFSIASMEIYNRNIKALNYILCHGCNINQCDSITGNSLLHYACKCNNWQAVTLILSTVTQKSQYLCGSVDYICKNKEGKNPQDLSNSNEIKNLLFSFINHSFRIYNPISNNNNGCKLFELREIISNICHDNIISSNLIFIYEGTKISKKQEKDIAIPNENEGICEICINPFIVNEVPIDDDNEELSVKMNNIFRITSAKEHIDVINNKSIFQKKCVDEEVPIFKRDFKFGVHPTIPRAAQQPPKNVQQSPPPK